MKLIVTAAKATHVIIRCSGHEQQPNNEAKALPKGQDGSRDLEFTRRKEPYLLKIAL